MLYRVMWTGGFIVISLVKNKAKVHNVTRSNSRYLAKKTTKATNDTNKKFYVYKLFSQEHINMKSSPDC